MIVHETHSFLVPIDSRHTATEGGHQVLDVGEQHVGQHGSFQMAPQSLDQVQTRTVGRQPEDYEAMPVGLQPCLDRLRVMEPTVVADQSNLATGVGGHQSDQEAQELASALFVGHGVRHPSGGEIDASVHDLLFVLPWGGDFGLSAHGGPHPGERGMTMNLDLILEQQGFRRVATQGFFFKRTSCFLAFS